MTPCPSPEVTRRRSESFLIVYSLCGAKSSSIAYELKSIFGWRNDSEPMKDDLIAYSLCIFILFSSSVSKVSVFFILPLCRRSSLLSKRRGMGRSLVIRTRESLVLYTSFNTLWCGYSTTGSGPIHPCLLFLLWFPTLHTPPVGFPADKSCYVQTKVIGKKSFMVNKILMNSWSINIIHSIVCSHVKWKSCKIFRFYLILSLKLVIFSRFQEFLCPFFNSLRCLTKKENLLSNFYGFLKSAKYSI